MLPASGAAIPISRLRPGDMVLAANVRTGRTQAEPVTAVLLHHDTDLYDLTVRTAHGTAVIQTTSSHLFWDPVERQWVKAASLSVGEPLKTPGGAIAYAGAGTVPAGHDGWMWDLTVPGGGDHDFYIAVAATAVLVHNCDDPYLDEPGEQHVREGHFPGGSEVDGSKGIFNADEDPQALAEAGAGVEPVGPNANGFYERLVNAGRLIGNASQDSGGLPTSYYRIVQDLWGAVITMYPELPK